MENDSRDNRASRERDRRDDNSEGIYALDAAFIREALGGNMNICSNEVDRLYTQVRDILF